MTHEAPGRKVVQMTRVGLHDEFAVEEFDVEAVRQIQLVSRLDQRVHTGHGCLLDTSPGSSVGQAARARFGPQVRDGAGARADTA